MAPGCPGIDTEPAPELALGCCSHGAYLNGDDDLAHIPFDDRRTGRRDLAALPRFCRGAVARRRGLVANSGRGRSLRVREPGRSPRRRRLRLPRTGQAHRSAADGHQARDLLAGADPPRGPRDRHGPRLHDGAGMGAARLGRTRHRRLLVVHIVGERARRQPARLHSATRRTDSHLRTQDLCRDAHPNSTSASLPRSCSPTRRSAAPTQSLRTRAE